MATHGSCSPLAQHRAAQGRGVLQTFGAEGKKGKTATSSTAGPASCCTSRGPGFAGWSAKHFPTLGAKNYKYSRHCNCITRLLPASWPLLRPAPGLPLLCSPLGPDKPNRRGPGLLEMDFGAGEDKQSRVGERQQRG